MPCGRGQQEQGLAERVQLELPVDPVADEIEATRIPGQIQPALVWHPIAAGGIGRNQPGPVGMKPVRYEAHGPIEQRVGACRRDRVPRVALVANPGVAVIVVTALIGPFRQARGGRGDHAAA